MAEGGGKVTTGAIIAVARDGAHRFSKRRVDEIRLVAGIGVEGDAHAGETVQHRSRVAVDPTQPNPRQVHLIAAERLAELAVAGFTLAPGELGENITTEGIDLLALPRGARLRFLSGAEIEVTGLRNPCAQIEAHRPGLLSEMVGRAKDGTPVLKCGIMAVVLTGGLVRAGEPVTLDLPTLPHVRLHRV